MVELVLNEEPLMGAHGQLAHLIGRYTHRLSVNDRNLVTLDVGIGLITGEPSICGVTLVHDRRIHHLNVRWWLEVDGATAQQFLQNCLKALASVRCKHLPIVE